MWSFLAVLAFMQGGTPAAIPDAGVVASAAPTDALTLADVTERAARASTALARARGAIAKAEADRDALNERFLPRIGAEARYTRIATVPGVVIDPQIPGIEPFRIPGLRPNQWFLGVGARLPVSDWWLRWPAASALGDAGVEAQEANAAIAARQAVLDARLTYWALARVDAALGVTAQTIADARTRREDTDKRVRAQLASPVDATLVDARIAEAERSLAELEHTRILLATRLRALLDLPPSAAVVLAVPTEDTPDDKDLETLVAEAWRTRPEPRALAAAEAALRAERKLASIEALPRFDVVGNVQLVDPNPRAIVQEDNPVVIWDVSAVVSWNVNGLWESDTRRAEVEARRQMLEADRGALDDGIRQEIAAALRLRADARAAAEAARVLIAVATEAHRVRSALYRAGHATTLEVAEAETQLERARLALVDARVRAGEATAQLDHARGLAAP